MRLSYVIDAYLLTCYENVDLDLARWDNVILQRDASWIFYTVFNIQDGMVMRLMMRDGPLTLRSSQCHRTVCHH